MDEMTQGLDQTDTVSMDEMVPKDRVTELVKREKEAAYRKAQREHQLELDKLKTGQTQSMGGMQQPAVDMEDVYSKITDRLRGELQKSQEEADHRERENHVRGQVETYLKKMDAGVSLADDFKEITAKFRPEKFKEVFYLANGFDNTAAIVYELGNNPYKLANLHALAQVDPDLAREEMNRLSQSIQSNEKAKSTNATTEPPLSRSKPSLASGMDNGAPANVQDFKKASWLRG